MTLLDRIKALDDFIHILLFNQNVAEDFSVSG